MLGELGIGSRHQRRRRQEDGLEHALGGQTVDHAGRHSARMGKAALGPGKPVAGEIEHLAPRRRHPFRLHAGKAETLDHRLRIEGRRRAQRHARHITRRRERIGGDPVEEGAHGFVERRAVEHLGDRPKLLRIDGIGFLAVPDHADDLARPERHLHDRARLHGHAIGHRIAIGNRRRHRHQNRHDAGRGERAEQSGRIVFHGSPYLPLGDRKENRKGRYTGKRPADELRAACVLGRPPARGG